jgi:hypothetical protein
MAYTPLTAEQLQAAYAQLPADNAMAMQAARPNAGGGVGASDDVRRINPAGGYTNQNFTAQGSPQFFNTLNAVDPNGTGNFGKDLQETTQILQPESSIDKFWQQLALASSVGALTAGAGGMLAAPATAALGTTAGGIAAGAGAGAVGGLAQGVLTSGQINPQDIGMGALGGGIAAGVQPLTNGLGDAIYNADPGMISNAGADALSSGLVKGGIGAGLGALSNGSNGALVGGLGGATAGSIGSLTDSSGLGKLSGTIAGGLANKYLTTPASPGPSQVPTAGPSQVPAAQGAVPAAQANTQQVIPTLPAPMATTTQGPSGNIGPYSGYTNSAGLGYQPRQQVDMSGVDWAHYGQGPEQQFFQPAGST